MVSSRSAWACRWSSLRRFGPGCQTRSSGACAAIRSIGSSLATPSGSRKIGGAVDLSMYKRRPYGPGWALVGDAGYHLDPLAARGVTAAVASAELLGPGDPGCPRREYP